MHFSIKWLGICGQNGKQFSQFPFFFALISCINFHPTIIHKIEINIIFYDDKNWKISRHDCICVVCVLLWQCTHQRFTRMNVCGKYNVIFHWKLHWDFFFLVFHIPFICYSFIVPYTVGKMQVWLSGKFFLFMIQ